MLVMPSLAAYLHARQIDLDTFCGVFPEFDPTWLQIYADHGIYSVQELGRSLKAPERHLAFLSPNQRSQITQYFDRFRRMRDQLRSTVALFDRAVGFTSWAAQQTCPIPPPKGIQISTILWFFLFSVSIDEGKPLDPDLKAHLISWFNRLSEALELLNGWCVESLEFEWMLTLEAGLYSLFFGKPLLLPDLSHLSIVDLDLDCLEDLPQLPTVEYPSETTSPIRLTSVQQVALQKLAALAPEERTLTVIQTGNWAAPDFKFSKFI